jgi:hypothetical protein
MLARGRDGFGISAWLTEQNDRISPGHNKQSIDGLTPRAFLIFRWMTI